MVFRAVTVKWCLVNREKRFNLNFFFYLKFILGKMLLLKALLAIFADEDCRFR